MHIDLEDILKSELTGFKGEVFFNEVKDILGDTQGKDFWIKNHGMNSRASSKDVLDITSYTPLSMETKQDTVFVHLSRNSIYHQLPEILFHPLVISSPSMSNREVVDAIRKNRKKEEETIHFFIPFDTALFQQKLNLTNRYTQLFTDSNAQKNLFSFARAIVKKDIPLSKAQYYKLFVNLCNAEQLKENLPALEQLLHSILGMEVSLAYTPCVLHDSPFMALGEGVLGHTLGTHGAVRSEQDDICATLLLTEQLAYKTLQQNGTIIKEILSFFIFANRAVQVVYKSIANNGFTLGVNYLGYDTTTCTTKSSTKTNKRETPKTILEPITI